MNVNSILNVIIFQPAFTNFMRELNKMRHFHRYQLEQQAGQPGAQTPAAQPNQPSSSSRSRDNENIITID